MFLAGDAPFVNVPSDGGKPRRHASIGAQPEFATLLMRTQAQSQAPGDRPSANRRIHERADRRSHSHHKTRKARRHLDETAEVRELVEELMHPSAVVFKRSPAAKQSEVRTRGDKKSASAHTMDQERTHDLSGSLRREMLQSLLNKDTEAALSDQVGAAVSQEWVRTDKASMHVPSSSIVRSWAAFTALEQHSIQKRVIHWEDQLNAVFHETRDDPISPNPLRTAAVCDVLRDLSQSSSGRLSKVLRPIVEDLLSSVYAGYTPPQGDSQEEERARKGDARENALDSAALSRAAAEAGMPLDPAVTRRHQQQRSYGHDLVDSGQIVPYFELVRALTNTVKHTQQQCLANDNLRQKLDSSQRTRVAVFNMTCSARQHDMVLLCFTLWRRHVTTVKKQRQAFTTLATRWMSPVWNYLPGANVQTSEDVQGVMKHFYHRNREHFSGTDDHKAQQGQELKFEELSEGLQQRVREFAQRPVMVGAARIRMMHDHFKAWKLYALGQLHQSAQDWAHEMKIKDGKILKETEQISRENRKAQRTIARQHKKANKLHAKSEELTAWLNSYHKEYALVSGDNTPKIMRSAAMLVEVALDFIDEELQLAVSGEQSAAQDTYKRLSDDPMSHGSGMRRVVEKNTLMDPCALLPNLDPAAAEERLLAMDTQALLLCWLNYHLQTAGCGRRAGSFDLDLQDSQCMIYLLQQITPRYNAKGTDVPRISEKTMIIETVDLELRAGLLLEVADKADRAISCDKESKFVHSLLTPRDIVASNHPDICAAWLADLCSTRFGVPFRFEQMEQGIRDKALHLRHEVHRLTHSQQRVVSPEWLETLMLSFAELYRQTQHFLDAVDCARRLQVVIQRRCSAFVLEVLYRRVCGSPIQVIDFRRERERMSALKAVTVQRLGEVLDPVLEAMATSTAEPKGDVRRRSSRSEVNLIRAEFLEQFDSVRNLFESYTLEARENALSHSMSFEMYFAFLHSLGIAESAHPNGHSRGKDSAGTHRTSKGKRTPSKVTKRQDPAELDTHTLTTIFMKASSQELREQQELKIMQRAGVPVELVRPELQHDGMPQLSLSMFSEVVVRLAISRYSAEPIPSRRVRYMLQHMFTHASRVDSLSFLRMVRTNSFLDVVQRYGSKLRKIFVFYASSVSILDDIKGSKKKKSAKEKHSQWENTIDFQEFCSIVNDIGMVIPNSNLADGSVALTGARGAGQETLIMRKKLPRDFDPETSEECMTNRDVVNLFTSIQIQKDRLGMLKENTELMSQVLLYPDFLQALSGLACFRYPSPLLPLEDKLVSFLERDFFPALRRKVQKGAVGQSLAVKNLIF